MFVKLYLVSIYAFLSFDFNVGATRIPVFKCMQIGWGICNIRQIDINPAERMIEDRSCFVDQGSNITIAFNFTPRFQAYNLKWSIWVETVIGDYKLEGVPPDARNLANYPTIENKINQFQSVVHIPSNTRAKLWVVRVTITGDTDKDVCCFLCEIRVRKPQITTVSSIDFDPTNPYDIVRKKVSYPSIWDFNEIVKSFQNDPNIFNKFILNNAVTTPRPSFLSIVKNAFRRLFGFKSEMTTLSKVPFLGNASSLIEYFSGVIDQSKQNPSEQTTHKETEISTINIEPEYTSTSEIITEDAITEITTVPNTITETDVELENIQTSKVDSEQKFATDDENESDDYEDDDSVTEATTTTVKTTRTKPKTTIRIRPTSKKGIAKSGLMKVSRPGIKKTVRPITKSTI